MVQFLYEHGTAEDRTRISQVGDCVKVKQMTSYLVPVPCSCLLRICDVVIFPFSFFKFIICGCTVHCEFGAYDAEGKAIDCCGGLYDYSVDPKLKNQNDYRYHFTFRVFFGSYRRLNFDEDGYHN
jgi:hypothetical protein